VAEHAVIAHLTIVGDSADTEKLFALEDRLAEAISKAKAGEFDGNEVGGGEYVLYMYGPDAEKLYRAVESTLRSFSAGPGSHVLLRWGPADDPSARQERRSLA
jgi:hypothetical protein